MKALSNLLVLLGIITMVSGIENVLEIAIYGEVRPDGVDAIMRIPLTVMIYWNLQLRKQLDGRED